MLKLRNRQRELEVGADYAGAYANRLEYLGVERFAYEYAVLERLAKAGLAPEPLDLGRSYLVLAFIAGETLTAYLHRTCDWSVFFCVGKAVARMHQLEVFHGDLNLGNVLRDEAGSIYFIDFESRLQGAVNADLPELELAILEDKIRRFHPALYPDFLREGKPAYVAGYQPSEDK